MQPWLALALAVVSRAAPEPTLRELIEPRGKWIGSAAQARVLATDALYAETLGRQFDMLTPENDLKFAATEPRPGRFDFAAGDALVAFAKAHGMRVRGHTLVWHNALPAWVTAGGFSAERRAELLRAHIAGVAGHFRGKLYSWDVVNEAVSDDGSPRETFWSAIGSDYVARAFRWAREADPGAKLFYNDYGLESHPAKADAVFELLRALKAAGVPVDGIGLQCHVGAARRLELAPLMRRFASLGLEIHVTEMTVKLPNPPSTQDLAAQADVYHDALAACLGEAACRAFVMWGFTDGRTWRRGDSPAVYDAAYRPKPAYFALRRALSE